MKIKPEHLEHMRKRIAVLLSLNPELVKAYQEGNFPNSDRVKDLQKRFCFDLCFMAGLTPWICEHVYPYANDDHVYTALKAVCPTLSSN